MWPGAALGMVLHRKRGQRLVAHAFDRRVVEIDVRDFQAVRHGLGDHREVVVLAGDLHMARLQVLDRVVAAMVAELQTPSLRTTGD